MKSRPFGAVLVAAACLVLAASPARADYVVKSGDTTPQQLTFKSFVNGIIHWPGHVMGALFGGVPTALNETNSGALDMTCVAGCSTTTDVRPASSTITAADAATTTATGQGSVSLVSGTPTANSFQTQAINGESSATVTTTGTFVATLQIEASYNGGVTYAPVSGLLRGTNLTTASITAPSVISLDVTGATNLRVRATSYTSGTATVQMAFSAAAGMTKILNGVKLVDSGGGDATDSTNHAVKFSATDGADVTQGAKADAACASAATACTVNQRLAKIEQASEDTTTLSPVKIDQTSTNNNVVVASSALPAGASTSSGQTTEHTDLSTLHTDMGLPIPAGTAIIGKVGIDQTTDGTTNAVHLVAGTALAGKVGLDQTTPGTTNAVSLAQIGATTVVTGGVAGTLGVGGTAAALATNTGNPNKVGCVFQTNTTAATTGQNQNVACDAFGNTGKSLTPAMATQITAQSATTANTANTATLAAAASKFTYISGFACTSGGATAASLITVTVAGLITGSMTYTLAIPAGVTLAASPLVVSFPNPIQGSAVNTAITVAIGAAGSGNTVEQCNAQGFQQ